MYIDIFTQFSVTLNDTTKLPPVHGAPAGNIMEQDCLSHAAFFYLANGKCCSVNWYSCASRRKYTTHLAQTTLEVVDVCSGLRSLTTMFALGAALAWFASYSLSKKWFLFFMAAPIAIFANIIRLTSTAILASKYGSEVAQGFLHEFSGFVIFFGSGHVGRSEFPAE